MILTNYLHLPAAIHHIFIFKKIYSDWAENLGAFWRHLGLREVTMRKTRLEHWSLSSQAWRDILGLVEVVRYQSQNNQISSLGRVVFNSWELWSDIWLLIYFNKMRRHPFSEQECHGVPAGFQSPCLGSVICLWSPIPETYSGILEAKRLLLACKAW